MIRNYFKTMLRSLQKRKGFAAINFLGLSIGMTVCMLLALYIQHELGWDSFHEKSGQIFRLCAERKYTTRTALRGVIPPSIGQAVQHEFPEVQQSVRVMDIASGDGIEVMVGDKRFVDYKTLMVDSNFFRVFDGQFLAGDVHTALNNPGSVVLGEEMAKRLFGDAGSAMGKEIILNSGRHVFVSGVCKDWPEKSHLSFDLLISMTGNQGMNAPDYYDFYTYNYLLLNPNANAKALEAKLPLIVEKYVAPTIQRGFGETWQQFQAEGNGYRYFLQPITRIHLYSDLVDEFRPGGSIQVVYLFTAIGIFILFLACINFINLSTALSVERAKEVGIRKTFGSAKSSIVWQFLGESLLFSVVSVLFAAVLTWLLAPALSDIAGSPLSFGWFLHAPQLAAILGFGLLTGLVAGIYPALILSSFRPISVLKGRFKSGRRGVALRNGLVVFQFAVSIILVICTIVVNEQMHYVLGNKLGYDKDNIISIDNAGTLRQRSDRSQTGDRSKAFIDMLYQLGDVTAVSKCGSLPDGRRESNCAMQVMGTTTQRTQKTIYVDDQYSRVLGLQMADGRFFSKDMQTDSFAMVLNETAVKDFGLTQAVGSKIISTEPFFNAQDGKPIIYTVIGVVKDYHFESLHDKIAPLVIVNSARFGWGTLAVKIKGGPSGGAAAGATGGHFAETVSEIGKRWKTLEPKRDIAISFLDLNISRLYQSEQTAERIVTIFSSLALFIACIGLLGLVTYATMQRTKEIGIRKVLGASVSNLAGLLSGHFLRLVMLACMIAFPIAWWATHSWLNRFAYHVPIGWWVFVVAGLVAVLIALGTISYQVVKAALANPVRSLRTE